jgi:antitoxin (DNA-binding transcriptional repressor) of toxin-antitoxin stability system
MSTITLQEAQARLAELVHGLAPGEGVTITETDRPVARLVTAPAAEAPRPVPGRCRGMLTIIAEDDEHLKDWAENMP